MTKEQVESFLKGMGLGHPAIKAIFAACRIKETTPPRYNAECIAALSQYFLKLLVSALNAELERLQLLEETEISESQIKFLRKAIENYNELLNSSFPIRGQNGM